MRCGQHVPEVDAVRWVPAYRGFKKMMQRGKIQLTQSNGNCYTCEDVEYIHSGCTVHILPLEAAIEYPADIPPELLQDPKYREAQVRFGDLSQRMSI